MKSSFETCCWRHYCSRDSGSGGGGGTGSGDAVVAVAVVRTCCGRQRQARRGRFALHSRSPRRESLGPLSPASQLLMAGTWIAEAPLGPGSAGDELETKMPPPTPPQLLLSRRSLSARPCASLLPRAAGIRVQQGSSALRLDRPRPASSAPFQELRPSLLLPLYPRPPALPPWASRVPSIFIGSLFLLCRHVSGATRTLCCCSFCSLPSCPDTRGAYSSFHRAKGSQAQMSTPLAPGK